METVVAYEANTHLPKLLDHVVRGERITTTRHGILVAVLQFHAPPITADMKSVIVELLDFRSKHSFGKISIREMIEAGRRRCL